MSGTFQLDGVAVPYEAGQTVMQAALAAGHYIPHLCYHPEFKPHGSCKLCTVKVNGRTMASCTMPAEDNLNVESNIEELNALRRTLVQMLFAEGNHFCPSCEKSKEFPPDTFPPQPLKVTCVVPSVRMAVPTLAASTPLEAFGLPEDASNGGHVWAHAA